MQDGETTPVFLLHGLGAHPMTLLPIEMYLKAKGFANVHRPSYPVDTLDFEDCLDSLDAVMQEVVDKDTEVILVGQSMGGVYANNLHRKGWKVKHAVYIGSPLHGAELLNQLERTVPTFIHNLFHKRPYDFLMEKPREETPPHPYDTITMGWAFSGFDGCVYRSEATLEEERNTHLFWADHRTIYANPRLCFLVYSLLSA